MNMRKYHPHRTRIKHALHEPAAALERNAHERRDARRQRRDAQLRRVAHAERRVLQIDEDAVVARTGRDRDDRHVRRDLDPEGL